MRRWLMGWVGWVVRLQHVWHVGFRVLGFDWAAHMHRLHTSRVVWSLKGLSIHAFVIYVAAVAPVCVRAWSYMMYELQCMIVWRCACAAAPRYPSLHATRYASFEHVIGSCMYLIRAFIGL